MIIRLFLASLVCGLAGSSVVAAEFVCGRDVHLGAHVVVPDRPLVRRPPVTPSLSPSATQGATITLVAGPGLAANAPALAAWQSAVSIWEARLGDNVTVVIHGDFAVLGAGILGATDFRLFSDTYDAVRDAMVADAAADETIVTQLPTSVQLTTLSSPGSFYNNEMIAAKANLRALGFDMSFDDPEPDGTITFSSDFAPFFDYDPSDGIGAGLYDFEAIVVHEIGHALGFYSIVDLVDLFASLGLPGGFYITPLDAFRMRPGDGALDFTQNPRILADGITEPIHMFHEGADLGLSTGANVGDGYQASHWKADDVTGTFLGIMDPTLDSGIREELQPNDTRVFGLIGWDVVSGPQVGLPEDPAAAALTLRAAGNPFRGTAVLRFSIPESTPVRIDILDARGRLVAQPVDAAYPAGSHGVTWNSADAEGRRVPAGVYYARLVVGPASRTIKLVRLH